ncbi:MAG: hypothetical protein M0T85_05815 [Dehalococcoidales bacterium]|nr:hypothetical protein [Dehalococcoidales bacterium]
MLLPSAGLLEPEVLKLLPTGVTLHTTRLRMRMATYEELARLADAVEEAASLLADAHVDIITFNCTLGSLIKGPGYDVEIIERIKSATGIQATTTTTAVAQALPTLGIRKLVLVSPYLDKMNAIEIAFLEAQGFTVLESRGLQLDDPYQQVSIEPQQWYRAVKEMQTPAADGYFISCSGIRVVDVIEHLEADLAKPVLTSNQALVWHALKTVGVRESIQGFGRLLRDCL